LWSAWLSDLIIVKPETITAGIVKDSDGVGLGSYERTIWTGAVPKGKLAISLKQ
jgi:hypothetical protein